jgi:hypothetical protein
MAEKTTPQAAKSVILNQTENPYEFGLPAVDGTPVPPLVIPQGEKRKDRNGINPGKVTVTADELAGLRGNPTFAKLVEREIFSIFAAA